MRVILLGKAGSGKSSTGNTILGRKRFRSSNQFSPVTKACEWQLVSRGKWQIKVMDTPSIRDKPAGGDEWQTALDIVQTLGRCQGGVHAILYVISLDRFTREEFRVYRQIKALLGDHVTDYAIPVFTGGDRLEKEGRTLPDLLRNAPKELLRVLEDCSYRSIVVNNLTNDKGSQSARIMQAIANLIKKNREESNEETFSCFPTTTSCKDIAECLAKVKEKETENENCEELRQKRLNMRQGLNLRLQTETQLKASAEKSANVEICHTQQAGKICKSTEYQSEAFSGPEDSGDDCSQYNTSLQGDTEGIDAETNAVVTSSCVEDGYQSEDSHNAEQTVDDNINRKERNLYLINRINEKKRNALQDRQNQAFEEHMKRTKCERKWILQSAIFVALHRLLTLISTFLVFLVKAFSRNKQPVHPIFREEWRFRRALGCEGFEFQDKNSDVFVSVPDDVMMDLSRTPSSIGHPQERPVICGAISVELKSVHQRLELGPSWIICTPVVECRLESSAANEITLQKPLRVTLPLPEFVTKDVITVFKYYMSEDGQLLTQPVELVEETDDKLTELAYAVVQESAPQRRNVVHISTKKCGGYFCSMKNTAENASVLRMRFSGQVSILPCISKASLHINIWDFRLDIKDFCKESFDHAYLESCELKLQEETGEKNLMICLKLSERTQNDWCSEFPITFERSVNTRRFTTRQYYPHSPTVFSWSFVSCKDVSNDEFECCLQTFITSSHSSSQTEMKKEFKIKSLPRFRCIPGNELSPMPHQVDDDNVPLEKVRFTIGPAPGEASTGNLAFNQSSSATLQTDQSASSADFESQQRHTESMDDPSKSLTNTNIDSSATAIRKDPNSKKNSNSDVTKDSSNSLSPTIINNFGTIQMSSSSQSVQSCRKMEIACEHSKSCTNAGCSRSSTGTDFSSPGYTADQLPQHECLMERSVTRPSGNDTHTSSNSLMHQTEHNIPTTDDTNNVLPSVVVNEQWAEEIEKTSFSDALDNSDSKTNHQSAEIRQDHDAQSDCQVEALEVHAQQVESLDIEHSKEV